MIRWFYETDHLSFDFVKNLQGRILVHLVCTRTVAKEEQKFFSDLIHYIHLMHYQLYSPGTF